MTETAYLATHESSSITPREIMAPDGGAFSRRLPIVVWRYFLAISNIIAGNNGRYGRVGK